MKLTELLTASAATPAFRDAVAQFLTSGYPNQRIEFDAGRCPPVKVERTLTMLLRSMADEPIDGVEIIGNSGCEYFRGRMEVRTPTGDRSIAFYWDCRWRAERENWRDAFGYPDQIRAAREFGYDCFSQWEIADEKQHEVPVSA
jgi:hypothetical protein